MTRFAICTALYEAGRPYLAAYTAGLRAAVAGTDACLVLAIDDFDAPDSVIAGLREICPVTTIRAQDGATPAQVRRSLITAGLATGAEILVFADMDDMLAANAPGLHDDALADADISFGDLELIDARGEYLHRRFFEGVDIPHYVNAAATLAGRNFLGLSNTAVRASALTEEVLHIPADVVAADWWIFTTLLRAGRTARRTMAPVGAYRLYGGNTLGDGVPATRAELEHAIDIAMRHYRAFPATRELATRQGRLESLVQILSGSPDTRIAAALTDCAGRPGVWFEFLDWIDIDPIAEFQARGRLTAA
tara:strand:- start:4412 stop:5332 length:921 start_codon:yes stop_codon:yes gene_type:complete